MHFVLKAIERYWDINDLAPIHQFELSNLVEGCKEVLNDLESKLDRYQSLGSNWKNTIDRMGWATTNIGPIRTKLMHNALYLSTFNATLTRYDGCKLHRAFANQMGSSSQTERMELSETRILESQALILHNLSKLQLEFEEGKRRVPAFSSVTVENIEEEDTWQGIAQELESTDIGVEFIKSNQGFIRSWIDQVVLADVCEDYGK